jgi:proline iminopeptidase
MSTFEHDGATLWYDDRGGSGLPLLVLHGGLGLDHAYLRPAFDALGPEVRVVYLDFRANGRSTGDADLTMARLAADVDALRAHLGLDRVALFGHSYGGFVALQYALDHGDHLTDLVVCDSDTRGPQPETMGAELERLGLDPGLLAAFDRPIETIEDLLEVFDAVEPAYFPHSPPGTARAGLADTIWRAEGSAGGSAALDGWDVAGRLGEIVTRTLVMTGADDFMFPPGRARLMADALPRAELTVFDACGHLPNVEAPEAFLAALRGFLLGTDRP